MRHRIDGRGEIRLLFTEWVVKADLPDELQQKGCLVISVVAAGQEGINAGFFAHYAGRQARQHSLTLVYQALHVEDSGARCSAAAGRKTL